MTSGRSRWKCTSLPVTVRLLGIAITIQTEGGTLLVKGLSDGTGKKSSSETAGLGSQEPRVRSRAREMTQWVSAELRGLSAAHI